MIFALPIIFFLFISNLGQGSFGSPVGYVESADRDSSTPNVFPAIATHESAVIQNKSYVVDGLIMQTGSREAENSFIKWGTNNNLTLNKIQINDHIGDFLRVNGSSGNFPIGFVSQEKNYTGRYLSMFLGNVEKSRDFQVSFAFDLKGLKNDYRLIFVNGPLNIAGWRGVTYYDSITANTSKLLDLTNMISSMGDSYISLKKITLVVQGNAMVKTFEFRIELGKTTLNPPTSVPGGGMFFVRGTTLNTDSLLNHSSYIINDLEIKKVVSMDFKVKSKDYWVVGNGWQIDSQETQHTPSGSIVSVVAKKPLSREYINSDAFIHLDVLTSLLSLGTRDALFLSILLLGTLFFFLQSRTYQIKNQP